MRPALRIASHLCLLALSVAVPAPCVPLAASAQELLALDSLGPRLAHARLLWGRDNTIMHARFAPFVVQPLSPAGVGDARPRWSPDGNAFTFHRARRTTWDVWLSSADLSSQRVLLTNAHTADWADSGRAVTAILQHPGYVDPAGYVAVKYTLATGHLDTIYNAHAPGNNGYLISQSCELDPSGRFMVTFTAEAGHQSYVIDLQTRRLIQNAEFARGDCNPGWAPGGTYITHTSRTSSRPVLRSVFDPLSATLEPAGLWCASTVGAMYYVHGHRVSPDLRWLAGGLWALYGNREVYVWDLTDPGRDSSAVRITFDSQDDREPSLHHAAIDTSAPRLLVSPRLLRFEVLENGPPVSPQQIYVSSTGTGSTGAVQATTSSTWLTVSSAGPSDLMLTTVTPAATPPPPGDYTDTVYVSCAACSELARVTVMLSVRSALEPLDVSGVVPGVSVDYFAIQTPTPDLRHLAPYATAQVDSINFPPASWTFASSGRRDSVGAIFEGFLLAPSDGVYHFRLESDEGATLAIDSVPVVDNSGPHVWRADAGAVSLKAGYHRFELHYVEWTGAAGLVMSWQVPGGTWQTVPSTVLWRTPPATVQVSLLTPSGGEVWEAGTVQRVRFTALNTSQVVIAYSLDGGDTYQPQVWTCDLGDSCWENMAWVVPATPADAVVISVAPYLGGTPSVSPPLRIVASGATMPRPDNPTSPQNQRWVVREGVLTAAHAGGAHPEMVEVYTVDGQLLKLRTVSAPAAWRLEHTSSRVLLVRARYAGRWTCATIATPRTP